MKIEDLKKICGKYNIRHGKKFFNFIYSIIIGKKKIEYVANILARVNSIHGSIAEIDGILKSIECQEYTDPAPAHNIYREQFNLVDLLDGYWYSVWEHHGNHHWKSKMLYSIMCYFTVNVWVISIPENFFYFKDFRAKLAKDLVQFKM